MHTVSNVGTLLPLRRPCSTYSFLPELRINLRVSIIGRGLYTREMEFPILFSTLCADSIQFRMEDISQRDSLARLLDQVNGIKCLSLLGNASFLIQLKSGTFVSPTVLPVQLTLKLIHLRIQLGSISQLSVVSASQDFGRMEIYIPSLYQSVKPR
jgi:hypothetical protein